MMNRISFHLKNAALGFINLYQRTFSPDHGFFKARHPLGFCRFYPSCSEFAKQAIQKHGLLGGVNKTIFRILKCTPLSRGGIDLP